MKIAIVRERADGETRVAATPETVAKLIGLGATVSIERGAGATARFPDADYEKAGATLGQWRRGGQGRRHRPHGAPSGRRSADRAPRPARW